MKFVTFVASDRRPRAGVLLEGATVRVLDLAAAWSQLGAVPGLKDPRMLADTTAIFAAGQRGLDAARALQERAHERETDERLDSVLHELTSVRLLAPVPRPRRIRDYLTFPAHAAGGGMRLAPAYEQMPPCYKGNHEAVIGPGDEIPWPAYTDQLDYELEPAFVIGAGGHDISVADAHRHIAGVTLFNDVSARDIQRVEMSLELGPSKSKDFCTAIGPCVATLDEVDEADLRLHARVNGELWSSGSTRDRKYSFAEVLAWASYGEDVHPGEVIAVGTVPGGCGFELDRWIQPGDEVALEMEGVGVLRNVVGARQPAAPGAGLPTFRGAPRFTAPQFAGDA